MPVLFAHQSLASDSLNGVSGRTFLIGQVPTPSPAAESCLSTTAFPMKVKVKVTQFCWTLCNPMDCTVHGIYYSPSQNTGVGSLSLLQGIFPTQGSNPHFLHFRPILYQLGHKGSPRIPEWTTNPFSRGSSRPRN